MNYHLLITGPCQFECVEGISFGSKAEVLCGIGTRLRVVKWPRCYRGWAFTINLPGTRAIDCLAIHLEPGANIQQDALDFRWDGTVRARTYVQQQVAILAYYIHKLVNDQLRRFEGIVLDVTPGFVAYRGIGLPVQGTNICKTPARKIEHSRMLLHRIVFVINDAGGAMLQGFIIVSSGEAGQIGPIHWLADPPIEPHDVGMIFLYDFGAPGEPIAGVFRAEIGPVSQKRGVITLVKVPMCGAVEGGIPRMVDIGVEFAASVHKPVMSETMRRSAASQPFSAYGVGQVSDQVPTRPHLDGSPVGKV